MERAVLYDLTSASLPRLAVVTTHPIQYQAPLWQAMAASDAIDVKVFYASDHGLKESRDKEFGHDFSWDVPLLDGYDHEFLPSVRIPGLGSTPRSRFPCELSKRLKQGKFDAVLIHGYATGAAWAGYWAARRLRLPILMRGESHLEHERPFYKQVLKSVLVRQWLKGVSYCLAIGQWNSEYWRYYGMPADRIRTTLYSIDNQRFRNQSNADEAQSAALRAELGITRDDTVFAYAGKLIHRKGVDTLIGSYRRLRKQRQDVRLLVAGTGPEQERLFELAEGIEGIHWLGFLNQSELPNFYKAADVLLVPSREEAWGLVVNEAMACGTPCIVSDAVGAGVDMVSGPAAGLVVPVNDEGAWCNAMNRACDRESRQLWEQNIPSAIGRADYKSNIVTIATCMDEILSRKGNI